jgi:hypothetical protein
MSGARHSADCFGNCTGVGPRIPSQQDKRTIADAKSRENAPSYGIVMRRTIEVILRRLDRPQRERETMTLAGRRAWRSQKIERNVLMILCPHRVWPPSPQGGSLHPSQ